MKKINRKGFTLVELLAVIIILAIVVGISIPAVLTTTNNAKKKAFQTAADTMADWIDRQYQAYQTGLDSIGISTIDPIFDNECISNDDGKKCDDSRRVTFVSPDFIMAAGLKRENVRTKDDADSSFTGPILIEENSNFVSQAIDPNTSYRTCSTTSATSCRYYYQEVYTMVSINKSTGRSCVKLVAKTGGDYPQIGVACGGICTSEWDGTTGADNASLCRPRNMN